MDHSAEERWMHGGALAGVDYAMNDAVVVLEGDAAGESGVVVSLQALAPEPLYGVELESGENVGVLQSSLRPANA